MKSPRRNTLMALSETSRQTLDKSNARPPHQERQFADEREENAAKYRKKVDELNRSRDVEIERALTFRGGR